MSSTLEATQQTLAEPELDEEVVAYDSEDVVVTADVEWCLESLTSAQQCESVSQFSAERRTDRATQNVADVLESPAGKHCPASWTFTQLCRLDEERLAEFVSERVPSPQQTSEQQVTVSGDLTRDSSVQLVPSHSRPTTDYESEGELDDLFQDVAEPSVLTQPTDACQLYRSVELLMFLLYT